MVQVVGSVILGAVLIQAVLLLVASTRRMARETEQQRVALDLLREQVALARARRTELDEEQELGTWKGYRKFEVKRRRPETEDICSFYLAPHDGKPLPPFHPGQYLTFRLHIPDPDSPRRAPKPTIRCYSLSETANTAYYRISVKRIPGHAGHPPGVASSFFHGAVAVGDIVDVKAPSGHFYLDLERQTPIVLIAGGVGITPVLAMLNTLVAKRQEREVWFFYGVRMRGEAMRLEQLEQFARDHYWFHLHVCYSQPGDRDVVDPKMHHHTFVDMALLQDLLPSNNFDFYICGPPPMMESLTAGLKAWGVPDDHVFFEAFGPASVKKASAATGKVAAVATKHRIRFVKSGCDCEWDGSPDSLLELAEQHEVPMDFGCRAGNCGTCLTAIRAGEVRYVVEPSAEPEPGTCLTCIAVPASDLELDA